MFGKRSSRPQPDRPDEPECQPPPACLLTVLGQGVLKQQAGLPPIALDRPLGDLTESSYLGEGVTTEEMEIDQLGEPRVQAGELVQGVGEALKVRSLLTSRVGSAYRGLSKSDLEHITSAFLGPSAAGVVDHDPPHRP